MGWLKSNCISHILCVAGGIDAYYPKHFTYKVIEIDDAPNVDISAHFQACSAFIDDALNKNKTNKVLVHCFAGMSRSVTVVSAYLMQTMQMMAVPVLKMVKSKRTVANPNAGFLVQLIKYQKVLGLVPSKVKKVDAKHTITIQNDDEKKNDSQHEDDGDKLSKKLSSPMVKQWESGRRPSLFKALDKLRKMKSRSPSASEDFDANAEDKAANALKNIIAKNGLKLLREVSDEENGTPKQQEEDKNHLLVDDDNDGNITPLDDDADVSFGDMVNAKSNSADL